LKLNNVNGCNDISFGDHSILEGDRIPPLKRHGQALEEELCFSGVLSNNRDAPQPISCVTSMAVSCHALVVSMANEQKMWVLAKLAYFSVLLCCSVSCCTGFDHCAADMGLGVCVWYCYVLSNGLTSSPWQQRGPIWSFVVISDQADIIIIIITDTASIRVTPPAK